MATLRNVSPLGDLDFPLMRRVVEAGEEFEVPDDVAGYPPRPPSDEEPDGHPGDGLLAQVGNFELVTTKGTAKAKGA